MAKITRYFIAIEIHQKFNLIIVILINKVFFTTVMFYCQHCSFFPNSALVFACWCLCRSSSSKIISTALNLIQLKYILIYMFSSEIKQCLFNKILRLQKRMCSTWYALCAICAVSSHYNTFWTVLHAVPNIAFCICHFRKERKLI